MTLELETPRLVLRAFQAGDLNAFYAYRNDPSVAALQGWNLPYTWEQAQEFIVEMSAATPGTPGHWYQWAMQPKSRLLAGRPEPAEAPAPIIGDIAYKISSDGRQAEIGITISRDQQGYGYAQEAAERLLAFLFDELGLQRVYANTDALNSRAVALLEKLGLRREAHFIENLWFKGAWASEFWYAILRREWNQKRAG